MTDVAATMKTRILNALRKSLARAEKDAADGNLPTRAPVGMRPASLDDLNSYIVAARETLVLIEKCDDIRTDPTVGPWLTTDGLLNPGRVIRIEINDDDPLDQIRTHNMIDFDLPELEIRDVQPFFRDAALVILNSLAGHMLNSMPGAVQCGKPIALSHGCVFQLVDMRRFDETPGQCWTIVPFRQIVSETPVDGKDRPS